MKIFQKIIAPILVLGLVSSLNFNLLPKTAQAGDWIGGPFQIIQTIKEDILNPITSFASKPFAQVLFYELSRLAKGELSDAGEPLAILDWRTYLNVAANRGKAEFARKFSNTFDPTDPYQREMRSMLEKTLGLYEQAQGLYEDTAGLFPFARPTLKQDLESGGKNYQEFVDSGYSLTKGGWVGWYSMTKPQNSYYAQIMMNQKTQKRYEEDAKLAARNEGASGFRNRSDCLREGTRAVPDEQKVDQCDQEAFDCLNRPGCTTASGELDPVCDQMCTALYNGCMANATTEEPTGVCLEYRVKNVGSEIHRMVEKELDFDIDWLISANEIEDLFSMLMTKLLGGKTQGPGWGTAQSTATPSSWAYKPYKTSGSFLQLSRKSPSLDERERARTEIVNLIDNAIGRMSRGVASCKAESKRKQQGQMPENQEKGLTRLENQLLDVLESYTPELYLRETGIPLQQDFMLLDPANAPYGVYGKTWSEIPFQYYPSDCAKFGRLCGDFNSELPTWEDISLDCKTCLDAINKNIKKCKENCGYNKNCLQECTDERATNEAITDKKCPPETIEIPPFQPGGPTGGGGDNKCPESHGWDPVTEECKELPYMLQKEKGQFFEEFSILAQIIGNTAFAENCREKYDVVQRTKNSCQDCIQAAEYTCETKIGMTEAEKTACINKQCDNKALFEDIAKAFPEFPAMRQSAIPEAISGRTWGPSPWEPCCGEKAPIQAVGRGGQDFYDRCEIQEKKDTCFACLKQYFMPANYAMEIRDYIGRGFIKHPYLLVETFYSRGDKSAWDIAKGVVSYILFPLKGFMELLGLGGPKIETYYEYHLNFCIGTCPEIMHAESQCENHSKDEKVPVGLICRATPETPVCRSSCSNLTTDPLDFKPSDADCKGKTQKGAVNPLTLVTNAAFRHRSKYCRALVGHKTAEYTKCSKAPGERKTTPESCSEICQEDYEMCIQACTEGMVPIVAAIIGNSECRAICNEMRSNCQEGCMGIGECGNNIVEWGEACDDGNTVSGDGCSADCLSDETCGNGIKDTIMGEACDDGNTVSGDGCSATCRSECGNGVVDLYEACDDGNTVSGDGCSADCLSDETCGNGIRDAAAGEECDDGNTNNGDGCSAGCGRECFGNAVNCRTLDNNKAGCQSQDGCSWNEIELEGIIIASCNGTATGCYTYTTQSGCQGQIGCTWEKGRESSLIPRYCGDGLCTSGETCSNCPGDCGTCPVIYCGDGSCNGTETCRTCPQDCGACPAVCGDGSCTGTETCNTCPQDCGACPYCGDGTCGSGENCANCPIDCGTCF